MNTGTYIIYLFGLKKIKIKKEIYSEYKQYIIGDP